MDPKNVVVLDISSDEEQDPHGDDYNWLSAVLEAVEKKSEDLDDVVVISQVMNSSTLNQQKSKSMGPTVGDAKDADEDDDDCVVLEGDPDTSVTEVGDDNAADTDDVFVVGQKGQIACRDFPHSRHTCAIYPFGSTSHEKYCNMCHCYVCDTRAPCPYWCIGDSTIDHCHSNDKEDIWKNQRLYFKTGSKSLLPDSNPDKNTLVSTVRPQLYRGSTQGIIRLAPNSVPQSQVNIRACSSTTSTSSVQNIRTRCRIRQTRTFLNKQSLQPRSQQLLSGIGNRVIRKDKGFRSHNPTSGTSTRLTGGCSVTNISGYAPPNHNQSRSSQTYSSPASSNKPWQDVCIGVNVEMFAQQNISRSNSASYFPVTVEQNPNLSGCQNQTDVNRISSSDTFQPTGNCQNQGLQQQPTVEDFSNKKLLSEIEDWLLLDNHTVPWTDPASLDESILRFDFETS